MSYYIELGESIDEGLARIGAEQNQKAIDALENPDSQAKAIHKARKHFKKLRAIFRLVRDATGQPYYKASNVFFRDLGRELAPMRDLSSLIEAAELLEEEYGDKVKKAPFEETRNRLRQEREAVREALIAGKGKISEVLHALKDAQSWFKALPVEKASLKNTLKSLHRVYKRGYKRYRAAEGASPHHLHQWRKRVKYLWYHHRLLKQTWPRVYKACAKEIKQLSDYLGDHHDFDLLDQKVQELYQEGMPTESAQLLHALCKERKRDLEVRALDLAQRIYAEKPNAFVKRQKSYLKAGLYAKKYEITPAEFHAQ